MLFPTFSKKKNSYTINLYAQGWTKHDKVLAFCKKTIDNGRMSREAVRMENSHAYNHFRVQVEPALLSKLEEFRLLGYDAVSENGLWEFLTKKKWKKVKEEIRLYEIIDDILAVKVSDYMNFATIETYKKSEFSFEDENDWKELLK
jgi:hypothetical protein